MQRTPIESRMWFDKNIALWKRCKEIIANASNIDNLLSLGNRFVASFEMIDSFSNRNRRKD